MVDESQRIVDKICWFLYCKILVSQPLISIGLFWTSAAPRTGSNSALWRLQAVTFNYEHRIIDMILDFIEIIFLKIYILPSAARWRMIMMNPSHFHTYRHQDLEELEYITETHISPLDVASNWTLLFKVLEVLLFSGTSRYSNLRESKVKVIGP